MVGDKFEEASDLRAWQQFFLTNEVQGNAPVELIQVSRIVKGINQDKG
ncbi:hypothetical protein ACWOBJ_00990 [Hutsoniella sourekii]